MHILKNTLIYSIISIFQKAVNFLLLPLYTAYLSKADYGIVTLVRSCSDILTMVFLLSLNAAVTRFFFDYKNDEKGLKDYFGTIVAFVLIVSSALTVFSVIVNDGFFSLFVKGIPFFPFMLMGVLMAFFTPVFSIVQTILLARQRGGMLGVLNILYFGCTIVLSIVFLAVLDMKAFGVLLAAVITSGLFFIFSIVVLSREIHLVIKPAKLCESLRYSLPLIPHSFSGWIMSTIDRLLLNNTRTLDSAGLYSIGFQFGNIINTLSASVAQAYNPWFFDTIGKGAADRDKIIKFPEYLMVFLCFAALLLSLFGKEILSIMTSRGFHDAWKVIPVLCIGYAISGLYYFFVIPIFYNKKGTKFVSIATLCGAIASTVLNALLVPAFDIMGAAVASLLANLILSVIVLFFMKKVMPVDYRVGRLYMTIAVFIPFCLFAYLDGYLPGLVFLCMKVVVFVILAGVAVFIYRGEFAMVLAMLKSRSGRAKRGNGSL